MFNPLKERKKKRKKGKEIGGRNNGYNSGFQWLEHRLSVGSIRLDNIYLGKGSVLICIFWDQSLMALSITNCTKNNTPFPSRIVSTRL